MLDAETRAICRDAHQQLAELRELRERLAADADDPEVLSELVAIDSRIASTLQALEVNESC